MQALIEIILLPLIGSFSITVFKGIMPKKMPGIWASIVVGMSFLLSIGADLRLSALPAAHRLITGSIAPWATGYGPAIHWNLYLDPLSGIWLLIIAGVGMLIHIYSIGYMKDDPANARYFSYLNFFVFSMLLLVLAGNLLILLIGWGLVGLASYLLVGFWFDRYSAVAAAKKAFVMNTLGDAGMILGIVLLYAHYHTTNYTALFQNFSHAAPGSAFFEWSALLLYVGAMAKSAQFPLHMWLADAMEGPTPVSALIHAATMVTAGVYLMARLYPLLRLAPVVHDLVAIIGAFTAFFAATIAIFQQDIKKILAYSTLSQLGYMMLGVGVGAYTAGVFHFMTHAFFKALLFLGAGSVIHALNGEQDLGKMGGLWKKMPVTGVTFLIGTLAISGIPPFSGFFSKEAILGQTFNQGHPFLWLVGAITAGMTAFYMFRLFVLTFFGTPRDGKLYEHAHESPAVMTVPLIVLAVFATIGGFFGGWLTRWLAPTFSLYRGAAHAAIESGPIATLVITVALGVIGIVLAVALYGKRNLSAKAGLATPLGNFLFQAWKMDDVWTTVVVRPFQGLGNTVRVIDRVFVHGISGVAQGVWMWAQDIRLLQSGYTRRYALSIMVGVSVILSYYLGFGPIR